MIVYTASMGEPTSDLPSCPPCLYSGFETKEEVRNRFRKFYYIVKVEIGEPFAIGKDKTIIFREGKVLDYESI